MKFEFSRQIFRKKNIQITNLMIIRSVGAELFHADLQTDSHDEANSRFRSFANSPKNGREIGPNCDTTAHSTRLGLISAGNIKSHIILEHTAQQCLGAVPSTSRIAK